MVAHITLSTKEKPKHLIEERWYVGKNWPITGLIAAPHEIGWIEIQADGDELRHFQSMSPLLPVLHDRQVTVFTGPWAEWINANKLYYYREDL